MKLAVHRFFDLSIMSSSPEYLRDVPLIDDLQPEEFLWIDIRSGDTVQMSALGERFELHELSIEDALTAGHSPKFEDYGIYKFMILRALRRDARVIESAETEEEQTSVGVALYLSPRYLITHGVSGLPWLSQLFASIARLPATQLPSTTYELAYRVVDMLTDHFTRDLQAVDLRIDELEEEIVSQYQEFDLGEVLDFKRELVTLRHIVRAQRSVITRLASEVPEIRDGKLRRYFRDIDDHNLANISTVDKQIDNLLGLRDVYFALANVQLGDIMRVLAVITTIAVPLNLVVGMYGMNFDVIPLLHDPRGFWLIMLAMVVLGFLMLAFFRRNRWI